MKDADIRQLARALYTGQYAPTNAAVMAGALSSAGVKHAAIFQDNIKAQTVVFVADESWAGGTGDNPTDIFRRRVKQTLKDNWVGFGGRIDVRPVSNRVVTVAATVQLTGPQYSVDVLEIADNVRAALRAYLDDRPDFYTFDNNMMASIVSQADFRILSCTSVTMIDMVTGATVTPLPSNGQSDFVLHYYLADNGVNLTTSVPS